MELVDAYDLTNYQMRASWDAFDTREELQRVFWNNAGVSLPYEVDVAVAIKGELIVVLGTGKVEDGID